MDISCPELSSSESNLVARILRASLEAVDPRLAIQHTLNLDKNQVNLSSGASIELRGNQRIRLIGIGKAAQAMTQGVLDQMGDRVSDGLIIAKHNFENELPLPEKITVLLGGHPLPSDKSVQGALALEHFLHDGCEDDLIICLISGGGSALATLPVKGTNLEEIQVITRLLLSCGANIGEMNTLRKHLDRVKGGGLARMAFPARMVVLVLSDVIGNPLDMIASGPAVADPTTYDQCMEILKKYDLVERVPAGILTIIKEGQAGLRPETAKLGDPIFMRVTTQIVASNFHAALAGYRCAQKEGMNALLLTTYLQGEAAQAGVFLSGLIRQIAETGHPLKRPACIVVGGETTVTLHGKGLGGRNQELALSAAPLLAGIPNAVLVTLGTDGEDGPTDAAGAVVTGSTMERARTAGLNQPAVLLDNDSYHFFDRLGNLLRTGPTGTNVNDLAFLFAF